MKIVIVRTGLLAVLLLLSAASAEEEIAVERDGDALVVRSPADKGNFLFSVPAEFARVEPVEAPLLLHWRASRAAGEQVAGAAASVRLFRIEPPETEQRRDLGEVAKERAPGYRRGYGDPTDLEVTGEGARRLLSFRGTLEGGPATRRVLLVRDGTRLYELVLDEAPAGSPFESMLLEVAEGFTLLEVKGAEGEAPPAAEDLLPRKLEHDFYKLALLKPEGFLEEAVDANTDRGLVYAFRRRTPAGDVCVIRVRAWLGRTQTAGLDALARTALDRFTGTVNDPKVPKSPTVGSFPGAKQAFRLKMSGIQPKSAIVVQEELLLAEHGNGWIYEVQVTTYGGAAQLFKKELKAFWSALKVRGK
ncbi:MAG: hypothetical protein ACT4PV_15130 [Planctomycetaceae bacterium]